MKKHFLLLVLIATSIFAQKNQKNWDKVIAFEKDGKTKSANEMVDKIYTKAIRNKQEDEIIRCFFYQSKYLQIVDENAQIKILDNLNRDINRVSTPSKAILNFIYAKCLNDYFNQNNYQINKRTNTVSLDNQFMTWTANDFRDKINSALEKTLEKETVLKATPLKNYESLFDYDANKKFKIENLFEYLLQENIDIYSTKIERWKIKRNKYSALSNDLLGYSVPFLSIKFDSITDKNLQKTLDLFQKKEQNNPSTENQLQRILFCKNFLIDNNEAYLKALDKLQKQSKDTVTTQKIQFEKATFFSSLASKETHPDYNIKAVAIFDSIISVQNHSNIYKQAHQKRHNILNKSLSIQLEKYIYPNENHRTFISYKNVDSLTISFYKINQSEMHFLNYNYAKKDSVLNEFVLHQIPVAKKNYSLKNPKDYFDHTTEIILPQLKTGSYLVFFESNNNKKYSNAYGFETITASNLTLLAETKKDRDYYQVLDRKTGIPVENVQIESEDFIGKTDKNGNLFNVRGKDEIFQRNIVLTKENDTLPLYTNSISILNEYNGNQTSKAKVEFYLDRAIYRPGQTVYFKGIAFEKNQNESKIVANCLFKVNLQDANNTILKEFEVTTNKFGSFSGEYVLPKNGNTGNFSISAEEPDDYKKDAMYDKTKDEHPFWDKVTFENSHIVFKVEEYKRPKFEINIHALTETYKVNQKIAVIGNASSFAGANVTDAKVTYEVRQELYLNNSYGTYEWYHGKTEIITQSETTTDAKGNFSIDFIAKPDLLIPKEKLPVFSYRIKATVTDSNGETQTKEQLITNVGYHALKLKVEIPKIIETKNKNSLKLESKNLNDTFIATQGEIKIYRIRKAENKFKPRVWHKPEIETISEAEFERLFPYEKNEKPIPINETGELVHSIKVNTEKDKEIPLDFMAEYPSGTYKVVFLATDEFNNAIENSDRFDLIQSAEKINPSQLFTVEQLNSEPKKDGFVKIKIQSIVPNLYVSTIANYKYWNFFGETNFLKDNETILTIPLQKEFEKSISVNFTSIYENAEFNQSLNIVIKEEYPKLEFEVESFRNKIEPGKQENWSFKLAASKTNLEPEVLASMYDKSLDQFSKYNWDKLTFDDYNNYYPTNYKSSFGFQKTYTNINNLNSALGYYYLQENKETKLMWFGFNFTYSNDTFTQREYQKHLNKNIQKPLNAKMISGIVSDKNEVLAGITIKIKGTNRMTTSDFEGYYQIEGLEGEILVFSYIGYNSKEQKITSKEINIELQEDENSLKEVVVVGYGTQKKSSLTGASATIEEDDQVYSTAGLTMPLEGRAQGLSVSDINIMIRGISSSSNNKTPLYVIDGEIASEEIFKNLNPNDIVDIAVLKDNDIKATYGSKGENGVIIITTKKSLVALRQVKARTNLSETAFFYPHLKTDKKGKISFNFTSPEALTAWKLRLLAHNKNAISGYLEKTVVTQKELMVVPNFPRFFREKDSIQITCKIANMTTSPKNGLAVLQLFDAANMQTIDVKMQNLKSTQNFAVAAYGNTTVSWKISIPEGLEGVQYKVLAKAGNYSDGEENSIPVLTNSMLVTESIPLWVRDDSRKEYTFENLKNNTSTTLRNHQFTLEYTSNPTWLAIESLPYLMEYEHECAEQTFARFYANALASEIINSNPKIASVFESWKAKDKSKLEENEELKSIILAETPWFNDSKSDAEKKQRLATLFDLEKMRNAQESTFQKLKQKQKNSGGFVWFDGGRENEYITRHILAGLGHLSKLTKNSKSQEIAKKGIPFIDNKFLETNQRRNEYLKSKGKIAWANPYSDLHYLYTRSFYLKNYPLSDTLRKTTTKYLDNVKENWLNYSLYEKGMAALALNRFGEIAAAKKIIVSLKETASNNEDWGMYWIVNKASWYWYQAPIETQALLIEAFAEVSQDTKSVDAMKVWLLKNKQTKNWSTTKATTEAVYALMMQGTDWLSVKDNTVFKIGNERILTKKLSENEKEAETGYLKLNWKADEIKKEMATIIIENKSKVPGYGGVYWQYFEDLDKIKNNADGNLSVSKELYLKKSTDKGDELQKITAKNPLKIGDLVTVRLVISAKENMEFVHLKDMRASCFEPVDVLSNYQYKAGLGFYKSTKDAATHFFFDNINKGTYVLEYDIRVNNSGAFSNGITTIQSMYAPEFSSHTKGIQVKVQ
ncbi:MAG: carboxypeptidase-like regulatory domain-containing protein [Bacteroidota bacterium]